MLAEQLFKLSNFRNFKIVLQENVTLEMNRNASTEVFCAKRVIDKYSNCKQLAIFLATLFDLTWIF